MYLNVKSLFISTLLSICSYSQVYAEYEHEYDYYQKLILVDGKKSRLMDGEQTPMFNFNKKEVLPYFLKRGWKIQSITLHEGSNPHHMYGYVVIEKKIMSKKTAQR